MCPYKMKVSLVSIKESHEMRRTRGNQSAVISLPVTPSVGKGDHGILITPRFWRWQICSTPALHRDLPTADATGLSTPGRTPGI